jgi:hypothetical protein
MDNGELMLRAGTPRAAEFIQALRESLTYCDEVDDAGSIAFEMARWQGWIAEWDPILDENGGI